MIRRNRQKKHSITVPKGFIPLRSEAKELLALLDEGNVEEFRRRVEANRLQRQREMYDRVLAGG